MYLQRRVTDAKFAAHVSAHASEFRNCAEGFNSLITKALTDASGAVGMKSSTTHEPAVIISNGREKFNEMVSSLS